MSRVYPFYVAVTLLLCLPASWAFSPVSMADTSTTPASSYGLGDTIFISVTMDSDVPAGCSVANAFNLNTNVGIFPQAATASVNNLFSASLGGSTDPTLEDPTAQATTDNAATGGSAADASTTTRAKLRRHVALREDATADDAASSTPTVGSNQIVFSHTVGTNENIVQLRANLTAGSASSGCTGYVSATFDPIAMVISTKGPSLISFSSRVLSGSNFTTNAILRIMSTFSRPITFSTFFGTPILLLNSGGTAQLEGYASPGVTSSDTLMFRYMVGPGEAATKLDVVSFILNQSSILDAVNQLAADVNVPIAGKIGSLSYNSNVKIIQSGQKFPPLRYDKNVTPGRPIAVQVEVQLDSLSDVVEKTLSFKAEILLVMSWYDRRLNLTNLDKQTDLDAAAVNLLWQPKVSLVNTRDRPSPYDIKGTVFNNGTVKVQNRYIQTFYCDFDVTKFPFDEQTFQFVMRSDFTNGEVVFVPFAAGSTEANRQLTHTTELSNPSFYLNGWSQTKQTISSGVLIGGPQLRTSIHADRISTFNSMNILFPLSLLCFIVCISFNLPLKSDGRISMCMTAVGGTLSFSFVLSVYTPPVAYITAMGLFIMMTYVIGLLGACTQLCIRYIHSTIDDLKDQEKNAEARIKTFQTFGHEGCWVPEEKKKKKEEPAVVVHCCHCEPAAAEKKDKEKDKMKSDATAVTEGARSPAVIDIPTYQSSPQDSAGVKVNKIVPEGKVDVELMVLPGEAVMGEKKEKKDKDGEKKGKDGDGEKKKLTYEEMILNPDHVAIRGLQEKIFGGLFVIKSEEKKWWLNMLVKVNMVCRVMFPIFTICIITTIVVTAKSRK